MVIRRSFRIRPAATPVAAVDTPQARLVAELKARSSEAWAHFYDTHYDKIHRYALLRLGRHEAAEDAAAITFQRALSAVDSYQDRGRPLLAWLYGIARNVVREAQRAASKHRAEPLDDVRIAAVARSVAGPDADATLRILDLQAALGDLTDDQREVLLLRSVTGLSAAETAAIIGKSEGAVYALQARAVEALRRLME